MKKHSKNHEQIGNVQCQCQWMSLVTLILVIFDRPGTWELQNHQKQCFQRELVSKWHRDVLGTFLDNNSKIENFRLFRLFHDFSDFAVWLILGRPGLGSRAGSGWGEGSIINRLYLGI